MSEPFIAEIRAFGFNFAPRGWMMCNGQLLAIAQNTALFSLLGTTYGGNGQTNFALPDLRGRSMISAGGGQGPGLSPYSLGEQIGTETVTLISTEMPAHNHTANAAIDTTGNANMVTVPTAGVQLTRYAPASGIGAAWNTPPITNPVLLNPQMVQPAGGGQPHSNQQPYLTLIYCIAVEGIFPARN
ncbi:tail fiber protein [Sphingomonas sp. G-3-2-10]|uniref:phage tail protein n=1 Tax=Sphingomonas sp. G-3-2-10 TaxID=2728838 RepID=UPI00146EE35B|nr:tail fiber protein [Sphingomonas sp. G-3-2-10]NML07436.1 phage tail protein [Sphingomonas sp. G-3-2-10]